MLREDQGRIVAAEVGVVERPVDDGIPRGDGDQGGELALEPIDERGEAVEAADVVERPGDERDDRR